MSLLQQIKAYGGIIKNMSLKDVGDVLMAYGQAAISEFNELPDEGEGVMTKAIYLQRKEACAICPLRTKRNSCDPTKKRIHVSEKKENGEPLWVNGCGCNLWAKQKIFTYHCPAGEW